MKALFDATSIGSLKLKNRFVRSATWEGLAREDGTCTQRLVDKMVQLAEGEVGLIISGHTFVSPEGRAGPWQLAVYDDCFVPELKRMADGVHGAEGKIVLQLAHAGFRAATELSGVEAVGPSKRGSDPGPRCHEMTADEIVALASSFAAGAGRAKLSGFDGVQIHSAHGYLLSQFLSPAYNSRRDDYGGTVQNRARFVLEVLRAIRAEVGPDYPVMIKLNSEDFLANGLTLTEMLEVAGMLEEAGIDAVELSGGTAESGKKVPVRLGKIGSEDKEGYYREAGRLFKAKVQTPLILVGGIRSFAVAESLVAEEVADYVSLCRPLIREPDLVRRWRLGDTRKAECMSDNLCFKPIRAGEGMYCYAEELIRKRKRH